MDKPKFKISDFTGMGDNGVYYLEQLKAKKINGQSVLSADWESINKGEHNQASAFSGWTNTINGFSDFSWSTSASDADKLLGIEVSNNNNIYDFDLFGTSRGKIHANAETASAKPDIFTMNSGDVIYTSARYVGIGHKGVATGGSATTLIDTTVNFTADYGVVAGDKFYNYTLDEEFTITSVSTTTNTYDTLNFSAGTGTPSTDDIYLVFNDNWQDLGTADATVARQIKSDGVKYYILNDNYLGAITASDESTFDANNKQLPVGYEATCIDINQERLLIGAKEVNAHGALLLWDGNTDGWLSILKVDKIPRSIIAYSGGWIVVIGARLYFCDGYNLKEIAKFPGTDKILNDLDPTFNGVELVDENLLISYNMYRQPRARAGLVVYDLRGAGWQYITQDNGNGKTLKFTSTPGAVKHKIKQFQSSDSNNFSYIASSWTDAEATNTTGVNLVINGTSENGSIIIYAKLPESMKVSGIGLNLSSQYDADTSKIPGEIDITVNYADGNKPLKRIGTLGANGTTTSMVNDSGTTLTAEVGQQVRLLQGNSGGERSYITEIANKGTNTETWTLSPAFSTAPTDGTEYEITSFVKTSTETVTNNAYNDAGEAEIKFSIDDFYSDKLYLEIIMEAESGGDLMDINSINIY